MIPTPKTMGTTMTEFQETKLLAEKILDRPYADPDDDLAMLARQFLRQVETVKRQEKALQAVDWQGKAELDLIEANRDEILRKHEEAVQRVRGCLKRSNTALALQVLDALNLFHPMHEWTGWPEGSEP